MSEVIDEKDIRELAYALWEQAGSPDGRETEFWEQAKQTLVTHSEMPDADPVNAKPEMIEPK